MTRLSEDARRRAANLLWAAWRSGATLDDLPADCLPQHEEDGFAIQRMVAERSDSPQFGWKIAATSAAGRKHLAVTAPLIGALLREGLLDTGASCSLHGNSMASVEPEFAFRLGADLPVRAQDYTVHEVLERVADLHPAIEVPSSRWTVFAGAGAARLLADNACAHQLVLGPPAPAAWRSLDLVAQPASITRRRGGQSETHTGSGAEVMGDPREALAWLVNTLRRYAVPLREGQVVITGACATPIGIAAGDLVEADFGTLGSVTMRAVA